MNHVNPHEMVSLSLDPNDEFRNIDYEYVEVNNPGMTPRNRYTGKILPQTIINDLNLLNPTEITIEYHEKQHDGRDKELTFASTEARENCIKQLKEYIRETKIKKFDVMKKTSNLYVYVLELGRGRSYEIKFSRGDGGES